MEAVGSVLSSSSSSTYHLFSPIYFPKTQIFNSIFLKPSSNSSSISYSSSLPSSHSHQFFSCPRTKSSSSSSSNSRLKLSVGSEVVVDNSTPNSDPLSSNSQDMWLPKIDKSGRFCSPRAARELALTILYAACLDGSDPVRLFEKRVNAGRESGYEFDKTSLMEYNHMSFGGPPVTTQTIEEADEISQNDQKESDIEAEVLSAPPKLVYSKLMLRFTRKLLVAVVQNWENSVQAIDKVAPSNWKNEPAGKILELSVLHLSMSEIAVLGTRHQIVINEAVDLAKRFCDGAGPRIINGCLRTFVKGLNRNGEDPNLKIKQIEVVGQ